MEDIFTLFRLQSDDLFSLGQRNGTMIVEFIHRLPTLRSSVVEQGDLGLTGYVEGAFALLGRQGNGRFTGGQNVHRWGGRQGYSFFAFHHYAIFCFQRLAFQFISVVLFYFVDCLRRCRKGANNHVEQNAKLQ